MTNANLCLEETIEALAIGLSDSVKNQLLLLNLTIEDDDSAGSAVCLVFSRGSEHARRPNENNIPMTVYYEHTRQPDLISVKSGRLILYPLCINVADHWTKEISKLLFSIAEREQYGNPKFSIVQAQSIESVVYCTGEDTRDPYNSMYKVYKDTDQVSTISDRPEERSLLTEAVVIQC